MTTLFFIRRISQDEYYYCSQSILEFNRFMACFMKIHAELGWKNFDQISMVSEVKLAKETEVDF